MLQTNSRECLEYCEKSPRFANNFIVQFNRPWRRVFNLSCPNHLQNSEQEWKWAAKRYQIIVDLSELKKDAYMIMLRVVLRAFLHLSSYMSVWNSVRTKLYLTSAQTYTHTHTHCFVQHRPITCNPFSPNSGNPHMAIDGRNVRGTKELCLWMYRGSIRNKRFQGLLTQKFWGLAKLKAEEEKENVV